MTSFNTHIYRGIFTLYFINFIMFLSFHDFTFTSYKPLILYFIKNGLCLLFFYGVTKVNLTYIYNYSFYIYLIFLFLLIFVHFLGIIGLGAKRWINLGVFYFQPSEFMKIALPIHLSKFLSRCKALNLKNVFFYIFFSMIPIFFVIIEPDLGTGIILITISGLLLFVGGLGKKYIITTLLLGLILCPIIWNKMYTYQKQRVLTFLTGGHQRKEGYQIYQSRITIGSGRFRGKGFMKGSQFRFHFLPKPETDFIFSCICEEWGFIGGFFVLSLFFYLTFISIITSIWKQDLFESYLCCALGIYIFFSFFFNIAMTMSLIPAVGVPLPILSRGGSATATFLLALGLLINIRRKPY